VLAEIRSQGHFRETGLPIDLRWASIFSLRNGKVVHAAGYLSAREALKAVGLEK
jgi:ketosteroid isomerase-like protein